MKYQLLQIHLTDAEVDKVNAEGHNSVPKQTMKLDMSVGFGKKIAPIAKNLSNHFDVAALGTVCHTRFGCGREQVSGVCSGHRHRRQFN